MVSDGAEVYTHGYHRSVVDQHGLRTAEHCAEYLLGHLRSGQRLLDAGCGPGSITVGLAARVAPAEVVALDVADEVLEDARRRVREERVDNVAVEKGTVYDIAHPADSFDIAHAHQLLQHLVDPVAALRELRRVVRPGGLVAARDADYGTMVHAPHDPRLVRWLELYHQITAANGADADAGRHLPERFADAGFEALEVAATTWCFADAQSRRDWGRSWADRALKSGYAEQALAYGLSDQAELRSIREGWLEWAEKPVGLFTFIHVSVLGRV